MMVLDFETQDDYIKLKLGAGWVYSLHVQNPLFKVLGFAVLDMETGETSYTYIRSREDVDRLRDLLVKHADGIIMHNAPYDLGCLLSLGVSIDGFVIYDTKIIAHLHDNRLMSYSLDNLSKMYLPEKFRKGKNLLVDAVKRLKLARHINHNTKTADKKLEKWCYENMDLLHVAALKDVADYAIQDAVATAALFRFYSQYVKQELSAKYSGYQRLCVKMRAKGVSINMERLEEGIHQLSAELEKQKQSLIELLKVPSSANLLSGPTVTKALIGLGISLPLTEKGSPSAKKDWLKSHDHPACKALTLFRTTHKLLHDFFIKPKKMQIYCCPEAAAGGKKGKVFPELNLFGADTGRFSSSNPNIQQIPKRDKQWAKLCRSVYVPNKEGNRWISADWSNQEGRIQLHCATKLKLPGAKEMTDKFRINPATDLHQEVADMAKIERAPAKEINLGLAYGMGELTLCRRLGLPTELKQTPYGIREVAGREAANILRKYHNAIPFVEQLIRRAMAQMEKAGYIETYGGRKLYSEGRSFNFKALNKLIQGSAADLCLEAIQESFDAGLDVLFPVHDEINIEGDVANSETLRILMEKDKLVVPMLAEVTIGNSWGGL